MINNLQAERKRLGLSPTEVADKISVGLATYYRWEAGKAIPSDKLADLAKLGFDVNFIVLGTHSASSNSTVGLTREQLSRSLTTFLFNTGQLGLLNKSESTDVSSLVDMAIYTIEQEIGENLESDRTVKTTSKATS
ncbi:XRE family transcriptional regulator [Pseudoalteromonas sp. JC28]|nr:MULTISPECIES: helix-turn-helix transcriptional regulator [Pseudoalteromonas]NSY36518.1 XRE family transcriptional regulator [Pseudoalteromonas sp. JC28]WMO14357.1 helix-turn-helix transcriptional regulator [Pseudoalteromonas piscicida]